MSTHVNVATRSHDYGELESCKAKDAPDVSESLHIERPVVESIPQISKCSVKCSTINPNARAAQNYSIVENLGQIRVWVCTTVVFDIKECVTHHDQGYRSEKLSYSYILHVKC